MERRMRIRCLVIDDNPLLRERILGVLKNFPALDLHESDTHGDPSLAVYSTQPNIVFYRLSSSGEQEQRFIALTGRLKWKCVLVPLLAKPMAELIELLLRHKHVVDILIESADTIRIETALRKALEILSVEMGQRAYYRGFLGFVGIIPSLRERKILATAGIGLLQNRSLRLAIDYWRKNPESQLIAVAFNTFDTFTTRPDELMDCWEEYDIRPWEYGLYEAQRHYLEYWKEPIREGLLPSLISTILREGPEELTPLPPQEVQRILVKVGNMTRRGTIEEIFDSMGIFFHSDCQNDSGKNYDEFIQNLEKQLAEVDKKHPELTRPPSETGYEDFMPDIASPYQDDPQRMAYHQKKRGS